MRLRLGCAIGVLAIAWLGSSAQAQSGGGQALPQLGKAPVKDVIAAMTKEEKVSLVMGTGMNFPGLNLGPDMQGPAVGRVQERVPGAAGMTFAIPRLGIPATIVADGPAGLRDPAHARQGHVAHLLRDRLSHRDAARVDLGRRPGRAGRPRHGQRGQGIRRRRHPRARRSNTHRNPLGGRNFEDHSEDPLDLGEDGRRHGERHPVSGRGHVGQALRRQRSRVEPQHHQREGLAAGAARDLPPGVRDRRPRGEAVDDHVVLQQAQRHVHVRERRRCSRAWCATTGATTG